MGGHIILACVVIINVIAIIYALRSKTWKRLSLSAKLNASVDSDITKVNLGDTGVCVTRLAPMGKVAIGDYEVEAQSLIGLLDARCNIEVVKIEKSKIIVKQI
jgi:membrane-bound ClpP family serine protease